jgi:3-hydroxyacyl-[acyl-carrier-protein] dehydratase
MGKESLESLIKFEDIKQEAENEFHARFFIDPNHEVFNGHFPNQPLLPGVIMVDIVRRCLEKIEGVSLRLDTASNIKFLHFLTPNKKSYSLEIKIKRARGKRDITARIYQKELVYFKQSASYIKK